MKMLTDAPLIISLASLLISIYTLWVTRLAGFELNVVPTARVELTTDPQSLDAKHPGVIMQLLFTNKGAQLGYVHDVALIMRRADLQSKPILLRSLFEHIEDSLNVTNQLPPPKLLAFTSFPLRPAETLVKKVLFVPFDPQSKMKFEQGRYVLVPCTRDNQDERRWKNWSAIEIEVGADDLQALEKTVVTPTADGGQFVKWVIHSKPTKEAEEALQGLNIRLDRKK